MKALLIKIGVLTWMLLGLPLLGVLLAGKPLSQYFEFPPQTSYVQHAGFSWPYFIVLGVIMMAGIFPFLRRARSSMFFEKSNPNSKHPFPWWGYLGLALGVIAWILAWNRFPWFSRFQAHTFSPLWFAYILVINALAYRRTGRCMLCDRTAFFLALFPASAGFWWFFEYLNRFVQNWYYIGNEGFGGWEYFWYATLPFSTVLPSVLGTQEWLSSFPRFRNAFQNFKPIRILHPKAFSKWILLVSALGLTGIGVWPNIFYPLLWVSPLSILVSLECLMGRHHVFSGLRQGNWQLVISASVAALCCGIFWETWNYCSFAKWIYAIPYVNRFHIFEMPILGYAGYLPFGLECAAVAGLLEEMLGSQKRSYT